MIQYNIYPNKMMAGFIASALSVFCERLLPLVIAALFFEMVDFITGCAKSAILAHRKGERFAFESVKAWRTIYKIVFILVGICMAEMLARILAAGGEPMKFANWFPGGICGVEFWSFLENAAVISDHPLFRWLRKFMKVKVEEQTGVSFDDIKQTTA